MRRMDLSHQRVIVERDVKSALAQGVAELVTCAGAVLTPSARDLVRQHGLTLSSSGAPASTSSNKSAPAGRRSVRGFESPEAEALKAEIVSVGRKLWQRQYVDGNGGNISARWGKDTVICTPTLLSKADVTPADLCLVTLEGEQVAGSRPSTSEISLHLEIYKAEPDAKAVVHCHPPHATAYAITGRVPTTCVIPEYELFIGSVALSPYDTPGTKTVAESVLPFVHEHNTVLLQNHGIVCWADTVTHAEWYVEVVDTYCQTLMLAAQLGEPITHIPPEKAQALLEIKKRLGLPDARLGSNLKECELCDLPELPGAISLPPQKGKCGGSARSDDVEEIVKAVTDAVMAAMSAPEIAGR